ncbi:TetR family transcriptional regulator [Actinomycetaceae bacterium L2_0104]
MGTKRSREPRSEQSQATRDSLLASAESLFAEHGVRGVSNRQISENAGQGNNTAVTYHFGTKQGLVTAILHKHGEQIGSIQDRLIASLQDPADLRGWITIGVSSLIEHLESLGRPSYFARFMAQINAEPGLFEGEPPSSLSLEKLAEGVGSILPDLPENIADSRRAMTRHLLVQSLADRERQLAASTAVSEGSWSETGDILTNAIVAIWSAPWRPGGEAADYEESPNVPPPLDSSMREFFRGMREDFTRLMMEYRSGVDEVLTKVSILREEFLHLHRYNPIEHVNSRVKTPTSILNKVVRKGCDPAIASIRQNIHDIAGVRITCSFIADTYRILEALTSQDDVRVIEIKDYIASPKASGYKSLHAIIEIPVFLSTGAVPVIVEVQIRTIAMDFWASLEHKIFYKYDGDVPPHLATDLLNAAYLAQQLDQRMEQLHREIHGDPLDMDESFVAESEINEALLRRMWDLRRKKDKETEG